MDFSHPRSTSLTSLIQVFHMLFIVFLRQISNEPNGYHNVFKQKKISITEITNN